jgi:ATP-binding cassette subfamily B protein
MQHAMARIRYLFWPAGDDDDEESPVDAAPTAPLREVLRRFWPDARPFRWWLAPLLLVVAIGPALETATIWLYKLLVDEVLVPRDFAPFLQIALAYVALTVLSGLVSFGDDVLSAWVSERFLLNLRTRVFSHLQRLPLDFFAGRRRGDLVTRLTDDIEEVEELLVSGVADFLSYLLRIVFFTAALFLLSWRLALLALTVAPVFWLASRVFSGRIKRVAREQRRRGGAIGAVVEESLANVPLVQAYNLEGREVARFGREAQANFSAQMALTRTKALFAPLLDLFELGGVLVVVAAGTWELAQGNLTLGGLLIFLTYLTQLLSPVRDLSQLIGSVAAATAGAERLIEVLDQPVAVAEPAAEVQPLTRARGSVQLENVSFRYPKAKRQSVQDISFHIGPGQSLAIVGASGAGKSTIARLLLRFYDPSSGRVSVDGVDVRDLDVRSLRENIAVVLQDSLVFAGTVRENIGLGRPGASERDVVRAAIAADAHDFIQALPLGYDTFIGQGGTTLSGGQRQRLAIARAFVRDAPILLLDEPTTGLDAETSERIMAPLRRLMADRATIVISHNLLTTREADEIVVLDRGRIVEQGSHEALLRRGGAYARLYRLHHPELAPIVVEPELAGVA